jgi:LmbE family N-acetylglucosaminyl deacetylase
MDGVARDGGTVILSPHFDDAVLSCWELVTSPRELAVVNVCGGLPARGLITAVDRLSGARESRELVEERIAEDAAVMALAGRTPLNLPLVDLQYRAYEIPRLREAIEEDPLDFVRIVSEESVAPLDSAELRRAIDALLPDVAEVWMPAAIGGHPDHRDVNALAVPLARDGVAVKVYADVPYAVAYGWPAWVTGGSADPAAEEYVASFLVGYDGFELIPTVRRLPGRKTAAKIEALRGYRTQFDKLNSSFGTRLDDPEIVGYEVSWALRPAPIG